VPSNENTPVKSVVVPIPFTVIALLDLPERSSELVYLNLASTYNRLLVPGQGSPKTPFVAGIVPVLLLIK
jgi:hypothetical protein